MAGEIRTYLLKIETVPLDLPSGKQKAPATREETKTTVNLFNCSGTWYPMWKADSKDGAKVADIECTNDYTFQFTKVSDKKLAVKAKNLAEATEYPFQIDSDGKNKFILIEPSKEGPKKIESVNVFKSKDDLFAFIENKITTIESEKSQTVDGEKSLKGTGVNVRIDTNLRINPLFHETPSIIDPLSGVQIANAGIGKIATGSGFSIGVNTSLELLWEGLSALRLGIEGGALWHGDINRYYCSEETSCYASMGYLGATFGIELSKRIIESWYGASHPKEDEMGWDLAVYAKFLVGWKRVDSELAMNGQATPVKSSRDSLIIPGEDALEAGLRFTWVTGWFLNLVIELAYLRSPTILNQ